MSGERTNAGYDRLIGLLRSMGSVAVAFSAGVDSTFLLRAAREALGDRVLAITVRSRFVPRRELEASEALCRTIGVPQLILEVDPFTVEGVRENPADRCYLCKRELFTRIRAAAEARGFAQVAEGSNADDLEDYRPGMRAIRELGIRSPLLELGLTKAEIRAMSRELGLPTWDKPAMACLATRIPTGTPLTEESLRRAEKAEERLSDLGFGKLRVRVHGDLARIELDPAELPRLLDEEMRQTVHRDLLALGFRWVSLDLGGYQMGSMNRISGNRQ